VSGADLIAVERQRQIDAEGWTPEHDDGHDTCDMTMAAVTYARHAADQVNGRRRMPPDRGLFAGDPPTWPNEWSGYWNPSDDPIRNLVKAGALIAAEIDRLGRLS
jgi:hypothetical protein